MVDILDNNTEYGAVMQEEKMKTTVKIHGSNEVGHAEGCVTAEDARDRLEEVASLAFNITQMLNFKYQINEIL